MQLRSLNFSILHTLLKIKEVTLQQVFLLMLLHLVFQLFLESYDLKQTDWMTLVLYTTKFLMKILMVQLKQVDDGEITTELNNINNHTLPMLLRNEEFMYYFSSTEIL